MATALPLVRDLTFTYGEVDWVSNRVRRIVARNPSPFTYTGTGTYIIGEGNVVVIDPGPADKTHIEALLRATREEKITHILITHTHNDHSPGARLLREHCDAVSYGFGPHASGITDIEGNQVEEGGDFDFRPNFAVVGGDTIQCDGFSFECLHTPGHTSNHVCYALNEEDIVFTGDHVMGWSTSVISPPDGNMTDYMASLRLLLDRDDRTYWPTHGPAITKPKQHVEAFVMHRLEREQQIFDQIANGRHQIRDMVPEIYRDVDPVLHPAAARSVYAAILGMIDKKIVFCDGKPVLSSIYTLS